MFVSKDVKFEETILYFSKKVAYSREGELMIDLFPLPACIDHSVHLDPDATGNHGPEEIVDDSTQSNNLRGDTELIQDESHEEFSNLPPTRRNPVCARQPPARL
ncbi:hypothetical protein ACFX2A_007579 [Malus domestica]